MRYSDKSALDEKRIPVNEEDNDEDKHPLGEEDIDLLEKKPNKQIGIELQETKSKENKDISPNTQTSNEAKENTNNVAHEDDFDGENPDVEIKF
jgi:hypothetical protein